MEPTNAERDERAYRLLLIYAQRTGQDMSHEREDIVCDLLTDLRHHCANYGIDFESRVQMSAIHFEAEEAEEGKAVQS
jgi:hypothetical protein